MTADRDTLDDWTYICVVATRALELEMDQLNDRCLSSGDHHRLLEILERRYQLVKRWRPERGEIPAAAPAWQPPRRAGWIGVDLDATLAHYERPWKGCEHIGVPIAPMVERVRQVRAAGYDVRILTARCSRTSHPPDEVAKAAHHIRLWCFEHFGEEFEVTCEKDADMVELWDDRAVGVEPNTGKLLSPSRVLGVPEPLVMSTQGRQLDLPGTRPARPSKKRAPRSTSRKTVARK